MAEPVAGAGAERRRPAGTGVLSARARTAALAGVLAGLMLAPTPADAARSNIQSYMAGRYALTQGDLRSASLYLGASLQAVPNDVVLRQRVFELTLIGGDVPGAIRLARDLAVLDPPSLTVSYTLMADAIQRGDWAGALKRADALSQSGIDSLLLPVIRAYADVRRNRGDAALVALSNLEQTPGFRTYRLEHTGHIQALRGDVEPAREAFTALMGEEPRGFIRQRLSAAALAQQAGDIPAARRLLAGDRAADRHPTLDAALARLDAGNRLALSVTSPAQGVAEAMVRLSGDLVQDEVTPLSLVFARLASYLAPGNGELQLDVAGLLIQARQGQAALNLLDRLPRDTVLPQRLALVRAVALESLDRNDEARALLQQVTGASPDRMVGWTALGDLERRLERWDSAIAAYDRAVALLDPPQPVDWGLFYARGIALERARLWPRAEADLQRALALRPDEPSVLNYLGYTWLEQNRNLDEATRMIERAVEQRPGDGYIVDSLGWAHFLAGRYDAALEQLERALDAVPGDPTINEHLGDVYWKVGREIEARFRWQAALDLGPDDRQRQRLVEKIETGALAPAAAAPAS